MLRAKEPLVGDLHKAILECIRPYSQRVEVPPVPTKLSEVF
jgi:hypothetical protein